MWLIYRVILYICGVKTTKKVCVMGKKLIIAFRIEDEKGHDVTPRVSNAVSTYLGEGVIIDERVGTVLRLAVRSFIFRAGGNALIRHLFPECLHRASRELYNNDADKCRWQVSAVEESRYEVLHPQNNN